jgi:hypothetical protein
MVPVPKEKSGYIKNHSKRIFPNWRGCLPISMPDRRTEQEKEKGAPGKADDSLCGAGKTEDAVAEVLRAWAEAQKKNSIIIANEKH